jgi:hypothetical protein
MHSIVMMIGMLGYGVGYEGYDDGKWYFGVYTPSCEYGYVVTDREIYLDTIFSRKPIDK